jgi:hypothetical protein
MKNPLEQIIFEKYKLLKPFLNEQNKRLFAASEAISLGEGGVSIVSRATDISRDTISKACKELIIGKVGTGETPIPDGKIRASGGGRKKKF